MKDLRKVPVDKRPAGKPTTGQSAEPRELAWEELTKEEQTIVIALDGQGEGDRVALGISALAGFIYAGKKGSNLRTRNALRRPVSCDWVEHAGRGVYKISENGRKKYHRALERLADTKKSA